AQLLSVKEEQDDEEYTEEEWRAWYALNGWTWSDEQADPDPVEPEPEQFELVVTDEDEEDYIPPAGPIKAKQRPPAPPAPSFPPPPPAKKAAARLPPPPPPAVHPVVNRVPTPPLPPPPRPSEPRPPWRSGSDVATARRSTSPSPSSSSRRGSGSETRQGRYVPGGHGYQLASGEYSARGLGRKRARKRGGYAERMKGEMQRLQAERDLDHNALRMAVNLSGHLVLG
ncbi:unnamed protein product, partial [Durusdinium trenchii]